MNTRSAAPDQQIDNLKQNWDQLSGVDRAHAVCTINQSGMSIRGIARRLQCGESSLRRLLKALDAPAADLAAARKGKISTNKLVRRAKAAAEEREKKNAEMRELKRKRKILDVSKTICQWLQQEHLGGSRGEAVALEARSMLISDYAAGKLPDADPKVKHPAPEWIEKCRPKTPVPQDVGYIGWYALWLAQWSYCFCRDAQIAIDAVAIAAKY